MIPPLTRRLPPPGAPISPVDHAPGHPYDPATGSGLAWTPTTTTLWWRGTVLAAVPSPTPTAWAFWYDLHFVTGFPQVGAWWFGSPWTQQVRAWAGPDGGSGTLQFVDAGSPRWPWCRLPGDPPRFLLPRPPLAPQAGNLPLQIVLQGLVSGVVAGRIPAGEWQVVSSLVARTALATALPLTPSPWCLAEYPMPLRRALCVALGLTPS